MHQLMIHCFNLLCTLLRVQSSITNDSELPHIFSTQSTLTMTNTESIQLIKLIFLVQHKHTRTHKYVNFITYLL